MLRSTFRLALKKGHHRGQSGSLMRPAMDRLRAYDKIEVVDRGPSGRRCGPAGPTRQSARSSKASSGSCPMQNSVGVGHRATDLRANRMYEQRSWTIRHLARMQVIPFADVRRSADSAAPVWSRMGLTLWSTVLLTESGTSLAFRTVVEKLLKC